MKNTVQYFIYLIGLIILFIILGEVNYYFQRIQRETYKIVPWSIYTTITYLPIGLYLGIPKFIKEYKKTGKWKLNYQKIIIIGLPILFLAFFWYLPFSHPIPEFLVHTSTTFRLGMIIVGYIFIDSLTKE